MTAEEFLAVHQQLHTVESNVLFRNQKVRVEKNKYGLRHVTIEGIKFIQQNPNKVTAYSRMAAAGYKITWGIRSGGTWDLAINDSVTVFNGQNYSRSSAILQNVQSDCTP